MFLLLDSKISDTGLNMLLPHMQLYTPQPAESETRAAEGDLP